MVAMKRKSKRRSGKGKPTAARIARSLNKLQKLEVKKLVKGPEEKKYVANYVKVYGGAVALDDFRDSGVTRTSFTSAITSTAELYNLVPLNSQGVDEYNRVGNRISPTRLWINGQICLQRYDDLGAYDISVHMFVLTCKTVKDIANYTAIPIGDLLKNGQGTNVGFDGTQSATVYPINTDLFHVLHHKVIRMKRSYGYVNEISTGSASNNQTSVASNTQFVPYKMNIKCPKTFVYEAAANSNPINFAPFLCIGWVRNDSLGQTAPNATANVMVTCRSHLEYTDA